MFWRKKENRVNESFTLISDDAQGIDVQQVVADAGCGIYGFTWSWCAMLGSKFPILQPAVGINSETPLTLFSSVGGTVNATLAVTAEGLVALYGRPVESRYGFRLCVGSHDRRAEFGEWYLRECDVAPLLQSSDSKKYLLFQKPLARAPIKGFPPRPAL